MAKAFKSILDEEQFSFSILDEWKISTYSFDKINSLNFLNDLDVENGYDDDY